MWFGRPGLKTQVQIHLAGLQLGHLSADHVCSNMGLLSPRRPGHTENGLRGQRGVSSLLSRGREARPQLIGACDRSSIIWFGALKGHRGWAVMASPVALALPAQCPVARLELDSTPKVSTRTHQTHHHFARVCSAQAGGNHSAGPSWGPPSGVTSFPCWGTCFLQRQFRSTAGRPSPRPVSVVSES